MVMPRRRRDRTMADHRADANSRRPMTLPSLILAAHGDGGGQGLVRLMEGHVSALRATGSFADVTAAYCKQPLFLKDALDHARGASVVVVPFFAADGYYTQTVVPREVCMRDTGKRAVRFAAAVGTHPDWADRIKEYALRAAATAGLHPRRTTLLIIGHGTTRHHASGDTVDRLCADLSSGTHFAAVACAFLDQEPTIEQAMQRAEPNDVLAMRFLVGHATHATRDIPHRLGLSAGIADGDDWAIRRAAHRTVVLARTMFDGPIVTAMIVDLARRASHAL